MHGSDGDAHYTVPSDVQAILLRILEPYRDDAPQSGEEFIAEVVAASGTTRATVMLRGCRAKWNMTQKALAEAAGLRQSHLSAMECGRRKVSPRVAQRLAKVLKCDWRKLVSE